MTTTLHGMLADLAREYGNRPALTLGDRTVTFAELESNALDVARSLVGSGARPGDRIVVLDKNSIEYYELIFGASAAGVVAVGLNFRLSPTEAAAIVADARPALIVADPEFAPIVAGVDVTVLLLGADYEAWRSAGRGAVALPHVDVDDVVLQMYSSGTTGEPKGAMLTHRNLSFTPRMGREFYGTSADSVNLLTSPLFHIGGTGYSLTTLGQGGHTVLARDFVVGDILAAIERHRVTNMFLVPTMIDMLVEGATAGDYDLSSLRLIAYGGAAITQHQLLRAIEAIRCDVMAVYGMTEAAGSVACLLPADHDPEGPRAHLLGSIGTSLPWHELTVRDIDTGLPCAPGEVGELCLRSEQTMAGYWGRPELTAATIDAEGWLHTGDAALVDENGFFFLKDRIKDMIITGGENVYPIEVESVLITHPAVREVAVIGVPHAKWGETVKAIIIAEPGISSTEAELIAYCRERLAHYKCPTSVDVVESFPRNASGKLLKRTMRERYVVVDEPALAASAP